MDKNLRNRMLAKTERHRIKRNARRSFLRANPNYQDMREENTLRSIQAAHARRHEATQAALNSANAKSIKRDPRSIFSKAKNALRSLFGRKGN